MGNALDIDYELEWLQTIRSVDFARGEGANDANRLINTLKNLITSLNERLIHEAEMGGVPASRAGSLKSFAPALKCISNLKKEIDLVLCRRDQGMVYKWADVEKWMDPYYRQPCGSSSCPETKNGVYCSCWRK